MGTSQAPVREALRELQNMRLIEFFPHRGTRVRQPSAAEISEIFAVRSVLEELATRLATRRSMPIGPLRDCHQGMLGAAKRNDLEGLIHESARFHRLIVEGSFYFQNDSPVTHKEAKWLPAPKRPFNLTTRLSILHVRRTDR